MSEHAEAGKALSIEQGGYQPLQIGDDDDSPHRTRISNNNGIYLEPHLKFIHHL